MEARAGALEDEQPLNTGADGDAGAALGGDLDVACFGAVTEEGMRVREAVDDHAGPAVSGDFNVGDVYVGVLLDEVRGDNGGEEFWWSDGVLFGKD